MRKFITILGILLTVTILIGASAVAAWVYADHHEPLYTVNCTDPGEAAGAPDPLHASLGQEGPPPVLGVITLDLLATNAMPPNQEFTVFARSPVSENYTVAVSENPEDEGVEVGSGEDTEDHNFYTPSTPGKSWRYVILTGTSGYTAYAGGDHAYGPDITAVGWDK